MLSSNCKWGEGGGRSYEWAKRISASGGAVNSNSTQPLTHLDPLLSVGTRALVVLLCSKLALVLFSNPVKCTD